MLWIPHHVIESNRVIKENGKQENDVLTPPLVVKEKTWDVTVKVVILLQFILSMLYVTNFYDYLLIVNLVG